MLPALSGQGMAFSVPEAMPSTSICVWPHVLTGCSKTSTPNKYASIWPLPPVMDADTTHVPLIWTVSPACGAGGEMEKDVQDCAGREGAMIVEVATSETHSRQRER